MKSPYLGAALVLFCLSLQTKTETVPDRKGAVLKDRATLENDPRWIYNDYERGFSEAKEKGKPLLVVLRCIPCLACSGIDAKVLLENTDLSPLLDKFVCVRVINANALDLSRFQFDYDLSFTTMIFNGDGTLYGRYGSWTHQKNPKEEATEGFREALEMALAIHNTYPANKQALSGKQARPTPFSTPLDLPTIKGKYTRNLDWEGKVLASCVHCHQIGEAMRESYRTRQQVIPSNLIYPFPAPETIGLELALDQIARVKKVRNGSLAEKAGLRAGDDLIRLDGAPLISIADVSWALHQAPEKGSLQAQVRRDQQEASLTIDLPEGWRSRSDISTRVGTWGMRGMALGGLVLEDLTNEERDRRKMTDQSLALMAKYVGEYGHHATARKAGFKKGDVIVELAGSSRRETEGELIGRLLKEFQTGQEIKATVLRGEERVQLSFPMQ